MNVGEVLDTVEQNLLSRQLSCLERFILCQSWLGHGYSEMAPECAYSLAHIKDIGSQLWQALSKALGKRVTKKNLFLVFKQYLFSKTCETVTSDPLSVTSELVEVVDPPLTPPTTNQLPVATDLVETSCSGDSEQLPRLSNSVSAASTLHSPLRHSSRSGSQRASAERPWRCSFLLLSETLRERDTFSPSAVTTSQRRTDNCCELVTEESSQQKCQSSTDNADSVYEQPQSIFYFICKPLVDTIGFGLMLPLLPFLNSRFMLTAAEL